MCKAASYSVIILVTFIFEICLSLVWQQLWVSLSLKEVWWPLRNYRLIWPSRALRLEKVSEYWIGNLGQPNSLAPLFLVLFGWVAGTNIFLETICLSDILFDSLTYNYNFVTWDYQDPKNYNLSIRFSLQIEIFSIFLSLWVNDTWLVQISYEHVQIFFFILSDYSI